MSASIDSDYLSKVLLKLLSIHSPTGYTDPIVREVCGLLEELGIGYEMTRRGAIRANLPGNGSASTQDRAIVVHLDTLGAMVKALKPNGRLAVVPVGTWSARFAEGARVSVFTDENVYRGTLLPLKASGHAFDAEVDTQPVNWNNLEVRVDETVSDPAGLSALGLNVGDFIGVDAGAELVPNGYINARHLDDKAGVAAVLAAAKAMVEQPLSLPADLHLLFTISEEVGSGASSVLYNDIAEMITVDNGTCAPGQTSRETGVTVAMADSTGPFDYHLTHYLLKLCEANAIPYVRDIFRYYRCDSASAVAAGNDIRTALLTFGVDASHGYERTTLNALESVARVLVAYAQSSLLYEAHSDDLNTIESFPVTRKVDYQGQLQEEPRKEIQTPPPLA
ncbi:MAG: osmoprotectant NAGGN system M42 family peptidase [Opitutales bacterium]